MGSAVRRPANPAIGELAVVRVTVAPDAEPGQRELRIATPSALSNPLVFCVGQLPEFSAAGVEEHLGTEKRHREDRRCPQEPQPGTGDEDHAARPSSTARSCPAKWTGIDSRPVEARSWSIAAQARELIPYIADAVPGWFQATLAVYDAQGKELAYDDDFQFNPDPVLYCEIPADGEYVVEIKDAIYRGREDFVYRITVGELPFVTGVFPLGGPAGAADHRRIDGLESPRDSPDGGQQGQDAGSLLACRTEQGMGIRPRAVCRGLAAGMPGSRTQRPAGRSPAGRGSGDRQRAHRHQPDDSDVFCFEGRAGDEIVAEVIARRLNSPLDSVLKLTDASGQQLALNDDYEDKAAGLTTHQADSWLSLALPADGKYYLHLTDMQHQGGPEYAYRLRISPPQPDFELRVVPASISARAGASVPLTVYALRKDGFADEITLTLKDAPPGFAARRQPACPATKNRCASRSRCRRRPRTKPVRLNLEGRATIQGREVAHAVVPAEDMMQAFAYRHLVPAQELRWPWPDATLAAVRSESSATVPHASPSAESAASFSASLRTRLSTGSS